jgi:hypothetical protein
MPMVSGRIAKFLDDPQSDFHALILEDGQAVRFPPHYADSVFSLVQLGSHIRVEGVFLPASDDSSDGYWEPALITNFDSHRSLSFSAPSCNEALGMPEDCITPQSSASRAPNARPGDRCKAAEVIGQSFDGLHRVQAIVAYLHIMQRDVPGIGQLLDEAKHTYVQALERFQVGKIAAAREFAAASVGLSRVVEILISRTLRYDSGLPALVPPPPDLHSHAGDCSRVEADLEEAEFLLSRIHWLLEHGTLPLEDRTQVRRITSWGDALFKQAQHSYQQVSIPDAVEFAQAALAGAHSAEHVCRRWYVTPEPYSCGKNFESLT